MTRRPHRQALAAGLMVAVAVGSVVAGAVGAVGLTIGGVALLLAGVALLLLEMRRREQVISQQLRDTRNDLRDLRRHVSGTGGDIAPVVENISAVRTAVDQQSAAIQAQSALLESQATTIGAARDDAAAAKRKVGTVQKTLDRLDGHLLTEAQALAQLLTRYSPRAPLPIVGGWALSPSGLLWLVDFVERAAPSTVVECGSGTSTLWLAHALRERGAGRLVALEHDPHFAERTRETLHLHGLDAWAEVRLSPLADTETPRGTFPWYDIDPPLTGSIDLLVVDGPPKATGRFARYPALPVLAKRLAADAYILVDDALRPDEKEAVAWWLEEDDALIDHGQQGRDVRLLQRR